MARRFVLLLLLAGEAAYGNPSSVRLSGLESRESREISRLMDAQGLPKGPFGARLVAFCACKVMVVVLKTVGRQLRRV